jgi:hypothetical protein
MKLFVFFGSALISSSSLAQLVNVNNTNSLDLKNLQAIAKENGINFDPDVVAKLAKDNTALAQFPLPTGLSIPRPTPSNSNTNKNNIDITKDQNSRAMPLLASGLASTALMVAAALMF